MPRWDGIGAGIRASLNPGGKGALMSPWRTVAVAAACGLLAAGCAAAFWVLYAQPEPEVAGWAPQEPDWATQ